MIDIAYEIESRQIELETYTEYYNDFQCPAYDCSLCMSEVCGRESLSEVIDKLEAEIEFYRSEMEGR